MTNRLGRSIISLVLLLGFALLSRAAEAKPLEFHVTFDKSVTDKPFTGRVFVMLVKKELKELPKDLPNGISWGQPEPVLAVDVKDWKPGDRLVIRNPSLAFPKPLQDLIPDTYSVLAIMDFGLGISFSRSDGNGYSTPIRTKLHSAESGTIELKIDQVFRSQPFPEKERIKLIEVDSKLLSDFHKRPIKVRASVALPKSFGDNPERKYPILYEIPGFSGNHFALLRYRDHTNLDGVEFLHVMLDPSCRTGNHVFADSANNGPCGQALIDELIPVIEKRYRALATPSARFLTGHSSGGWSSLWLQITYPDVFGGVWSTAPDPVDFRDFQLVNVYTPGTNIFTDADGKPRPLSRNGLKYKPFSDMEEIMGHGGQLQSFEAVFSPRGTDGQPMKLWDRKSGAIDPKVAKTWEKFDIRLIMERNWPTLAPKLKGKIHVYMGDEDTYYLDGATRLRDSQKQLGSDAVIELFPGKDHRTLMTEGDLPKRMAKEMAEQFRKGQR